MKIKNSSIILAVSIFILSGCVTKSINTKTNSFNQNQSTHNSYSKKDKNLQFPNNSHKTVKSSFALLKQKPIQACVGNNCKASFVQKRSEEKINSNIPYYSSFQTNSTPPQIDNFSKKTSIQVGAFRRYKGAKIYAKRYSLLSSRYKTVIKNGFKDNIPIYRVRIEGFSSKREAKKFMARYSLNSAFLVSSRTVNSRY
jgi:hypothetical protein